MVTVLIIIHLIACFSLIAIVLLQTGKGAELGAAFGGASQTLFGSPGPGGFLTKITTGVAALFMLTSLTLAIFSPKGKPHSVIKERRPAKSSPAPIQKSLPIKTEKKSATATSSKQKSEKKTTKEGSEKGENQKKLPSNEQKTK